MKEELEKQLAEKYPALFRGKDMPVTENLMAFGCECGDGWFRIIAAACSLIQANEKNNDRDDFMWTQIKEKYGTLRLYHTGGDDYTAGVIAMAEAMSGVTCEVCGAPGLCRGVGWLVTLCETHNHDKTLPSE